MQTIIFLSRCTLLHALVSAFFNQVTYAGTQQYEPMLESVRVALAAQIADTRAPEPLFKSTQEKIEWLTEMSARIGKRMPDTDTKVDFLKTLHYEAKRAGLDPAMVLGLIQVESNFRKYAISKAGARGYMQIMPFWTRVIGDSEERRLFEMRVNLRYGCLILRHYLDLEKGNLFRALGRYNGSLGRSEYPNAVLAAWQKWK